MTRWAPARFFFIPLALLAGCQGPALAAERAVAAPAARAPSAETGKAAIAIFAGGCYWGVEGVFSHVRGVTSVVSGFAGDTRAKADYETVSTGGTRHAEAVRVRYDPAVVRYDELLRIYFSVVADPTQLNRQGPDTGPQYRSALVPLNAEQSKAATAYLAQLREAKLWDKPIATRIEPYRGFYPAPAYHQDYMLAHPDQPYIVVNDAPKVAALKAMYPALWKAAFTRD